jgi:3-dehydroquinate synthase
MTPRNFTVKERFSVPYAYPVVFTRGVWGSDNGVLLDVLTRRTPDGQPARVAVCLDEGLTSAWPGLAHEMERWFESRKGQVELAAGVQRVPGGERAKNDPRVVRNLVRSFLRAGLCRHSYVIAIGGGAVLDAVGFAAGLVHRGVRLVRLPSTTLAQADAGVGVKNGVNFDGVKNAVGMFAPPFAVINDLEWLGTLSDADWMAGVVEAIKVSVVRDRAFFRRLETLAERLRGRDGQAMELVVRTCAALHLAHIREGGDPFERGTARPLDFGHWSAHALETISGYQVGHGQAVAFGIRLDTRYAQRRGWLPPSPAQAIFDLLDRCGFTDLPPPVRQRLASDAMGLLGGLDRFREHLGGRLCVTFPRDIGRVFETDEVDRRLMAACLRELLEGMEERAAAGR